VQYDLCQLAGAVSDRKHAKEGGPGLAACAELIRRYSAQPAAGPRHLLRWVFFNLYVGNNDSHASRGMPCDGKVATRIALHAGHGRALRADSHPSRRPRPATGCARARHGVHQRHHGPCVLARHDAAHAQPARVPAGAGLDRRGLADPRGAVARATGGGRQLQDVFDFRNRLVDEYAAFSRSFSRIAADDLAARVDEDYARGGYPP
jgi:hypothetical protein